MGGDQAPIGGVSQDTRSQGEKLFFTLTSTILMVVRLFVLIYFTTQTIRHVRITVRKSGRTDRYTLWTFICLNLSFLGFFIYDGILIGLTFAKSIAADQESKDAIAKWEDAH